MSDPETGQLINSDNLKVHPRMKELYKFFKYNGKLVDIENFNSDYLDIFSRDVLDKIENNQEGWEEMLPDGVAQLIKDKQLFNYHQSPKEVTN